MFRRSNYENANQVPHKGAGLGFALFTLMTGINSAGIEGIGSPANSVRDTLLLGGLAVFSFLGMKANVEASPPPAAALPLLENSDHITSPIIEGAAAVPLEDLLWIAQTGQRPVSLEAEATRAASAALLNEGL